MKSTAKLQNFQHAHLELDLNKVLFAPDDKGIIQYEIWKDIPDYEGHYQVSSFGRVKSLERNVKRRNHTKFTNERILKQAFSRKYPTVGLKKNAIQSRIQVHQLVAIAFLNHKRCQYKIVVDHKDNIRTNNFIWNLQLLTNRKNIIKNPRKGTSKLMGVSWNTRHKKWRGLVYHNGKNHHLGFFDTEEEASEYYKNALIAIKEGKPIQIKRKKLTSKHRGIYRSGKKWALKFNKTYYGLFDTEELAIQKKTEVLNSKKQSSDYKGVSFCKKNKNWKASIYHNGKRINLGAFDDEKEASEYYKNARKAIENNEPIIVKKRKKTSKHKYIYKADKKWAVKINNTYYGTYDTEEEALKVRDRILNSKK